MTGILNKSHDYITGNTYFYRSTFRLVVKKRNPKEPKCCGSNVMRVYTDPDLIWIQNILV